MTVVIVKPGYAPYEAEINGLDEMQEVVGGTIQAIYPFEDRAAVVCNDEGILLGMPYNRSVPGGYGGVFCVRLGRRGLLLFDPGAGQILQEGISLC